MKTRLSAILLILATELLSLHASMFSQDQKPLPTENFYNKSLHFTNGGITYAYSKEHGGLERLTGIPGADISCSKDGCHAKSCDACHAKQVDGRAAYSLDTAVALQACAYCHDDLKTDVHVVKGMNCMSCHTTREIHGDGVEHTSYAEPGFFDARCGKCHATLSQIPSHTVHRGKLDCAPCHVQSVSACYNCHIDTRLAKGKETRIGLKNIMFLVNHNGKVQLGNFLTYVYKDKTMMTFGPTFPHNIAKKGRGCAECHNTGIVNDIRAGNFAPVRWTGDSLANTEGVVPVFAPEKWKLVFLTKENNKWTPLKNPAAPILNYSNYCTPLTEDQLNKLAVAQGK